MTAESKPQPLMHIVMPYYGDPALLSIAVASVLDQSDAGWRLTVLDDAYPDASAARAALEAVGAHSDPRVELRRNATNLGVSGSFRRAAELANAPYSVIMGCDDIMESTYVARLRVLVAEFPDAAYLQPGVTVVDDQGDAVRPLPDRIKAALRPRGRTPRALGGEGLAVSLLRGNWTYFPSLCWRTDVLRAHRFRDDLEIVLDLALQVEIVAAGGVLVLDEQPAFRYRRHARSVSSWSANDGTRFDEERKYFIETAHLLRRRGWRRASKTASHHVVSRLNALSRVPSAVRSGDRAGITSLLTHATGMARRRSS